MKRSAIRHPAIRLSVLMVNLAASIALFFSAPSMAWDATAHRTSAYLTWDRLSDSTRRDLMRVLAAHPRLESDFTDAMPTSIRRSDPPEQQLWLFGQAAVWPDIARGLPGTIRDAFNHPDWHWIDGALIRDHASEQGNIYLGVPRQPGIEGHRQQNANVLTALEQARRQLLAPETEAADRALALSWFLHLAADLHQPLHTGALFAPGPLRNGDRGGNLIPLSPGQEGNNLHALWDRALRYMDNDDRLSALQQQRDTMLPFPEYRWEPTRWLAESRRLLHGRVYPPALRSAIRQGIDYNGRVPSFTPSSTYRSDMLRIARRQLIVAAERMAATLTDMEIPE